MPSGDSSERFTEERLRMVSQQLSGLGRSITDPKVLEAVRGVPRHEFVPEHLQSSAYDDAPLPIGFGQTISQPYVVAFMTQALNPQPGHRILEIGTGSGYQAAVLACLAGDVYTVEIIEELALSASKTFARLGMDNIHLRIGDGYAGWPEAAPFDGILLTCAPEKVPEPLEDQLAEGGKMILPLGPTGSQDLLLLEKHHGKILERKILQVRFVPMTGVIMDQAPR